MKAKGKLPLSLLMLGKLTSKAHALVVVFSIYDPNKTSSSKYRQVGVPEDGGIRHTSVRKNGKNDEPMELVMYRYYRKCLNIIIS